MRTSPLSFRATPAALDQAVKTAGYNGRDCGRVMVWDKGVSAGPRGAVSQRPHQAYQQPGEHDCSRVVGAVVEGAPVRFGMVDDKEAASVPARVPTRSHSMTPGLLTNCWIETRPTPFKFS